MRLLMFVASVALLAGCKKAAPSTDDPLAASLAKNKITIPTTTGRADPIPELSMLLFVLHDAVAADSPPSFALAGAPVRVFAIDPAHVATDGADAKYRKAPGDSHIVPLMNVGTEYVAKGTHTVTIASSEPIPPKLYEQIRTSLFDAGVGEQYRLVRGSDGKIAQERLPPM